jgi:hypothetical protein
MGAHLGRRPTRRHLTTDKTAVARGGGIDMDEIGDRRFDTRIKSRPLSPPPLATATGASRRAAA